MKNFIFLSVLTFLLACGKKETSNHASSNSVTESQKSFTALSATELSKIETGLRKGIKVCDCYKTKSNDFSNVYAVACNVKGGNIAIGVWALGGSSGIFSVELPTSTISDWGVHPDIKLSDDGFQEVMEYVRNKPGCE